MRLNTNRQAFCEVATDSQLTQLAEQCMVLNSDKKLPT